MPPRPGRRNSVERDETQADFSVPLGSTVAMAPFCTRTRRLSAISTVMKLSPISAHRACDAAVGDDFVAVAELVEHRAMFLLPLHLRADHQEVHDRDQDDREQERHALPSPPGPASVAWAWAGEITRSSRFIGMSAGRN